MEHPYVVAYMAALLVGSTVFGVYQSCTKYRER